MYSIALPTSQLVLQPFRCFTYVTARSPTLLSLLLRHRFSLTSPREPPMDQVVIIQMVISATGVVPKTLEENIKKLDSQNYVIPEIKSSNSTDMSHYKKISKS